MPAWSMPESFPSFEYCSVFNSIAQPARSPKTAILSTLPFKQTRALTATRQRNVKCDIHEIVGPKKEANSMLCPCLQDRMFAQSGLKLCSVSFQSCQYCSVIKYINILILTQDQKPKLGPLTNMQCGLSFPGPPD